MPRRSNRADSTKAEEILRATYDTIVKEGLGQMTTMKIAEKTTASKALIHYHFANKNELVIEVVRSVLDEMLDSVERLIAEYPTNRDRVEKGIDDFWEAFKADSGPIVVLFEASVNGRRIPELHEKIARFQRELPEKVARVIMTGSNTSPEISPKDARAIADILVAVMEFSMLHYLADPESGDFDYTIQALKRFILTFVT